MHKSILAAGTAVILMGCGAMQPGNVVVDRVGQDDLLKLRAGPSLNYSIVLGLPDGTALNRRTCVTELGQRWCEVSLADAPQIRGYVSADYLRER
jgi:uncharacterized protein YraI